MTLPVQAGNYSYTVSIPTHSGCDYTVCAFVNYKITPSNGCTPFGYSTAPECANIQVGGSNVFNINTPAGSTFLGVNFAVSANSFYQIFSTSSAVVAGNCNTMSNPLTYWTMLSPTSFTLAGQNVVRGKR